MVWFRPMNEAEMRQWVEANPGLANEWDVEGYRDVEGYTPLYVAVEYMKNLSLVLWLLDEKGANVNAIMW